MNKNNHNDNDNDNDDIKAGNNNAPRRRFNPNFEHKDKEANEVEEVKKETTSTFKKFVPPT
jgi:hypothetical protein